VNRHLPTYEYVRHVVHVVPYDRQLDPSKRISTMANDVEMNSFTVSPRHFTPVGDIPHFPILKRKQMTSRRHNIQ